MTRSRLFMRAVGVMLAMSASSFMAKAHDPARTTSTSMARAQLAQSLRAMDPECYCWANGQRFAHGEQACVRAPGGTRLAICDRVTNVMSWSFSADPCPES